MITDFKKKKLAEYLEPDKKVLIRFGHGWGDTQMFMPIVWELRRKYPDTRIDLYVECGQEEIFASIKDKDAKGYDFVFSLDFPMSEGLGITKQEKCLRDEIGLQLQVDETAMLPQEKNPFVLVHFQGTALPDSVNCPPEIAMLIWNEIIEAGFIPIECHFKHIFHNPKNEQYGFIDRDVRGIPADLHKLIGMIRHCFAFIGVASGPFITSLSQKPANTMYLEKNHKLEAYTKQLISKVDINNYKPGTIKEWLNSLSLHNQTGVISQD